MCPSSKSSRKQRIKRAISRMNSKFDRKYEHRRIKAYATITALTRDDAQRVIGATANINGISQKVAIDVGMPVAVGDVLEVENRGSATLPHWGYVRKVQSTQPIPGIDVVPTLPTPTALDLRTGFYPATQPGGSVAAWVYASWHTIPDAYGQIEYELEYWTNDATARPSSRFVLDVMPTTTLSAAINASVTVIPRHYAADKLLFPKYGRAKIESELFDYDTDTWGPGDTGTGTGSTNLWTDSGKSWTPDHWINYVLIDGAGVVFLITDNTATTLTVSGTPTSGSYEIQPAFSSVTRGVGGSTATTHADNTTIIRRSCGMQLDKLLPDVDYNIRVRATRSGGAEVSAWTATSSIQTDIDDVAPPNPTGLDTEPAINGIKVFWTGPSQDSCPDLAGFYLYTADDSSGTNPVLRMTLGPQLSAVLPWFPGGFTWVNIKAFDTSGNVSGYASSWVYGQALLGLGVNLLRNADFERDGKYAGYADYWFFDGDLGSTYGMDSGQGVREIMNQGTVTELGQGAFQSAADLVRPQEGPYTVSIFIKSPEIAQYLSSDSLVWLPKAQHTFTGSGNLYIDMNVEYVDPDLYAYPVSWSLIDWYTIDNRDDGWWRFVALLDVTIPATHPGDYAIGFHLEASNDCNRVITVYFDRAQVEFGGLTDWSPNLQPSYSSAGGTHGLLIDSSGILSADRQLIIGDDGFIHSNLERSEDGNTRNLGSSSYPWTTIYGSTLSTTTISGNPNFSGTPTGGGATFTGTIQANIFDATGRFTGDALVIGTSPPTAADNCIRASSDISAAGGFYAGNSTGNPSIGQFIGTGASCGIAIGTTPPTVTTNDIRCTGDFAAGGGFAAGSSSADPNDGWFQGSTMYATSRYLLNDTTDDHLTTGMILKQATGEDDNIISLKNNQIAHDMTSLQETDTFAAFIKNHADYGGLKLWGLSELTETLYIQASFTTPDTNSASTSSIAPIMIAASQKSGTSHGLHTVNSNILVVREHGSARMVLKETGYLYVDGDYSAFDEYDDLALIKDLDTAMLQQKDPLGHAYRKFITYNRDVLEATDLVSFDDEAGTTFLNLTKFPMLFIGAFQQMADRIAKLEAALEGR